jgi:DNA-binding CsgD family transcriptional regulator
VAATQGPVLGPVLGRAAELATIDGWLRAAARPITRRRSSASATSPGPDDWSGGWKPAPRPCRARGSTWCQRRGGKDELTDTERQICELAITGLRNAEIAARLFLSGKTVEANLSRAYRKLGVRSRTEMAGRLAGHP